MIVEVLEVKINKNDAIKAFSNKLPLMSRVIQFNKSVKNPKLQYIEYKLITYEITSKLKTKGLFKYDIKKFNITMFINTQTGHSESIEIIPETIKSNIPKDSLKICNINEKDMINAVKNEIIRFLCRNRDKANIQDVKLIDIKSIYKPFWIGHYDDKYILLEA